MDISCYINNPQQCMILTMTNIYQLYETLPLAEFKSQLLQCIEDGQKPPLEELFIITELEEDLEILGLINELIYLNIKFYERSLIAELNNDYHFRTKATIINVLTSTPSPLSINALTQNYIEKEQNRPIINKKIFKDKKQLAFALMIYCTQNTTLSSSQKESVRQLLKRIPITTLQRIPALNRSQLFFIYQTIPPSERYEEVKAQTDFKETIDENI